MNKLAKFKFHVKAMEFYCKTEKKILSLLDKRYDHHKNICVQLADWGEQDE